MAVKLQTALRSLTQINRNYLPFKHVRTFLSTNFNFRRISVPKNSDLKSRIRIVEDEKVSYKIVRAIINLGDPVAVDVEVSVKVKVGIDVNVVEVDIDVDEVDVT